MSHGSGIEFVNGRRITVVGRIRERCVAGTRGKRMNLTVWLDFRKRFLSLLSFKFREFGSVTALSVLEAANAGVKKLDEDPARRRSTLLLFEFVFLITFVFV